MNEIIDSKDISVVVQGPVNGSPERPQAENITQKCLLSIRKHLPKAKIILSTWEGSEVSNLDYDTLILSNDPGAQNVWDCNCHFKDKRIYFYNVNRQIVSTINGLKKVTTKYAMKLRADNILIGTGFINIFNKYAKRSKQLNILTKRVINSTYFAVKPNSLMQRVFHPSDWFFFGLTEDLLNIFDIPLSTDINELHFRNNKQPNNLFAQYCHHSYPKFTAEQYIWTSFLKKHISLDCKNFCDANKTNIKLTELSIVNNLILASPKQIGISSQKRLKMIVKSCIYTHMEWKYLYKKYCDPSFKIKNMKLNVFLIKLNKFINGLLGWPKEIFAWHFKSKP